MYMKDWKQEILTIPNLLSLLRLVLIPVYIVIYLGATETHEYFLAGSILAVSCITDMIDGQIARRFHMITNFGKLLDPVADKLTQFTLVICLSLKYPAMAVVLILFVIKECFQLTALVINLKKRKALDGALLSGKICTAVLFISFILLVVFPMMPYQSVAVIAVTDSTFLLIAFLCYILAYFGKDTKLQNLDSGNSE